MKLTVFLEEGYHNIEVPIISNSVYIQYNLNGSNRDGSFTVDDLNSFFSPYKILPTVQKKTNI